MDSSVPLKKVASLRIGPFLRKALLAALAGLPCCLSCSSAVAVLPLPYAPVIVFTGIVNNDSLCYPGNRQFPNSCRIEGNCVRMFLYSENYSHGAVSYGDQMRIDIYRTDSQFITERTALFDLTRYDRGIATPTYTITASDSLNDYNNFSIKVETFDRRGGGEVFLRDIYVTARPLGQYASEPLKIVRGVISGRIE
jgi:hypothetical protein